MVMLQGVLNLRCELLQKCEHLYAVCLNNICPRELNGDDLPHYMGGIQPTAGLGQSRSHELIQMGIFNFILKLLKGEGGNLSINPSFGGQSRSSRGHHGNGYNKVMAMAGVSPGASEEAVRSGLESQYFSSRSIDLLLASPTFRKMMNW